MACASHTSLIIFVAEQSFVLSDAILMLTSFVYIIVDMFVMLKRLECYHVVERNYRSIQLFDIFSMS